MLVAAPAAGAHALVRSSEPASGALLAQSPAQVVITFTERPDPALSVLHVLDSSGRNVEKGRSHAVAGNALQLAVGVGELPKGVYTVTWRTVSRVDGHVTAGAFAFGIGVTPEGAAPPRASVESKTPPPSALAVAGRLLLYAGLALLAGGAATALFVFHGAPPGRGLLVAGWGAVATGLAAATIAEASSIGISVSKLLQSTTGAGYTRQLVSGAAAGVLVVLAFKKPGRLTFGLGGLGALAIMITHVLAGHAGGATSNAALKVAIQTTHILIAGAWIGGLAWLLLGIRGAAGDDKVAAVRSFSKMAGVLIVIVAATGSLRVLDLVGSWHRLWSTSFGAAALIKIGLFAVLALLGGINRFRHVPALGAEPKRFGAFRKAVAAEIAVAVVVFGVTGAMAGLPPPSLVAASAGRKVPQSVVVTGSDFATSVRVRLTVTPGAAGPNTFEARLADFDTGKGIGATRVALRLTLPSRPDIGGQLVELQRADDVTWRAKSAALAIQGQWNVAVVIEKPSGNVEVALRLRTRLPKQKILVSAQPGQPTLYTIVLPDGRQVQAYLDPGDKPGPNDVHFTFFDAAGDELPVESVTMSATPQAGDTSALDVRRFGPGHFVSSLTVSAGGWLFEVSATPNSGGEMYAYFEPKIP